MNTWNVVTSHSKQFYSLINSNEIHTGESPLKYNVENLSLKYSFIGYKTGIARKFCSL